MPVVSLARQFVYMYYNWFHKGELKKGDNPYLHITRAPIGKFQLSVITLKLFLIQTPTLVKNILYGL
jgi:hypothetical protein